MAVPARPASGAVVDSVWGQVVHDTVVANDIETGSVSISLSNAAQGSANLTFARPFSANPVIVAMIVSTAGAGLSLITQANNVSPTGATIRLSQAGGGSVTVGPVTVMWIAMGPRS